ncbi:sporulation integral membrane protein YtvI [Clostridium sp. C8-1-8]|uniref:sporulation integral membrane protein YtvI n=1 Tax=Clostridium sp. C8-1-8 TaxID=2698831 RepID=UPI0013709CE6|nr:sporulation integral membrane protein YtvI [Clostridium sp. C8-1-8]
MDKLQQRIERLGVFFIIYTLFFYLFFSTLKYTIPFVLAILSALLLRYPTRLMIEKLKFNDWLASLLSTLVFFGFFISLNIIIWTSIVNELIGLIRYLQKLIANNSSDIYNYFMSLQDYLSHLNIDPSIVDTVQKNLSSSATRIINLTIGAGSSLVQSILTVLSYVPYIGMVVIFTLITTYFFTKKVAISTTSTLLSFIPIGNEKILLVINHVRKMLKNYILSYLLIIFITFIFTFIGFTIFRVKYSLILSILCAVLDLLPVLGIPLVYIPLAIMNVLSKNYVTGFGILILYAIVFFVRQIIEPKIMSTSLGLNPLAVLAAIFIGIQAGGIIGMLFCMFLVVFYEIFRKVDVL